MEEIFFLGKIKEEIEMYSFSNCENVFQ